MATAQPLQNVVYHDDSLHDLRLWAKRQVLRIEDLSEQQVLSEVQDIMKGHSYSWHCINGFLQNRFDEGSLESTLVDGDVLFEWNNLCDEKRAWEKKGRLSVNDVEFNMDCLINLKILPVQAGLGIEELHLVTSNMDKPDVSTVDLWAGPKNPERSLHASIRRFLANDDILSSGSEDSDYFDEEEETDDEDLECKDVVELDDEDNEGSHRGSDFENLSEESSIEESEYCTDGSDKSDEMETEDEDIDGLGVNIVDFDEEEISDLEL